MKILAAAAVAFAGLTTASVAQTTPVAPVAEAPPLIVVDHSVVVAPFQSNAADLQDTTLTDGSGVSLGTIVGVVGTTSTAPTALIVDLAESDADVVVPLDRFNLRDGTLTVTATAAELAALPAYSR